jgi:hypothetical protein
VPVIRNAGVEKKKASLECRPPGGERARGGYPLESESSDEEEEKVEVTPPLLSPLCMTPPLFSNIASL